MKYIIEHMDNEMYEWFIIEYKHISKIVGKENLLITNVKKGADKIKKFCKTIPESIAELGIKKRKICVLDMNAKQELRTEDQDKFEYFVFGGILGDDPPQKRTQKIIAKLNTPETRHLGKKQMTLDSAVLAAKLIFSGKKLNQIKIESITVKIGMGEEVTLPCCYVIKNGKPSITPELVKMLKREKVF